MGSIDLQHALGREPFGEGDIVHPAGGLAFAQPPLGFDASERGEAGKGRRIRGRRDYAGAPPLLTVMSALDPLMEGKLALFVGLRESLERTGKQRPVVSLQLQGVMTPLGADLLGHSRVAMQGVGSHGAAFQGHGFQRRQGRRHFVAARRMAARQRQARLGVPDADHQRRHEGSAALVAAAQALAVDGDHAIGRRKPEFGAQRRLKPAEGPSHFLGIEQAEEAAEAVVARRAMRQIDDLGQLGFVRDGEIGNVDASLGAAQCRRKRNKQHRRQIMPSVEVARIANLAKNGDQRLHHRLPSNQEASSESTSSSNATASTHTMSRWTGRRSRPTPPSTRRCATSGWASGRRNWKPRSRAGWTPRRRRMRKKTPPSGATRAAKRCRPQVGDKKRRAETIRAAKAELEAEARAAAEVERKARAEEEKKREAEGRKKPGRPAAPPSDDPDPKAQKNFTDPESRIMKTKDGFIQGYNAQAAVDAEAQVIVAHGLDANSSDQHQLTPMVDAVEANMGRKPDEVSADAGYCSDANLAAMEERAIDAYIAPGRAKHAGEGQGGSARIAAMREKIKAGGHQTPYRLRKQLPEPVFGQIKQARGLRQFLMRGLNKVAHEWGLVCLAHNVTKLARGRSLSVAILAAA